jgi:uncharacterized membrane protein
MGVGSGSISEGLCSVGQAASSRRTAPKRWQRLVVAIALAIVVFLLAPVLGISSAVPVRLVAAWDGFALLLLTFEGWVVLRSTPVSTRGEAASEDLGPLLMLVIIVSACVMSVIAAVVLLRRPHEFAPQGQSGLLIGLGLLAVVSAWLLTHTSYALHYARLYYADREKPGGLNFPGHEAPTDWDFVYFSFVIGMTFQVSDVSITRRAMRRSVLLHALVSFLFNTAILALAISLVVGRLV